MPLTNKQAILIYRCSILYSSTENIFFSGSILYRKGIKNNLLNPLTILDIHAIILVGFKKWLVKSEVINMKTKKSILLWFRRESEHLNDLQEFNDLIDRSIGVIKTEKDKFFSGKIMHIVELRLNSPKWKYPLWINFVNDEAIRISGF